jgi:hypothetical protein
MDEDDEELEEILPQLSVDTPTAFFLNHFQTYCEQVSMDSKFNGNGNGTSYPAAPLKRGGSAGSFPLMQFFPSAWYLCLIYPTCCCQIRNN